MDKSALINFREEAPDAGPVSAFDVGDEVKGSPEQKGASSPEEKKHKKHKKKKDKVDKDDPERKERKRRKQAAKAEAQLKQQQTQQ